MWQSSCSDLAQLELLVVNAELRTENMSWPVRHSDLVIDTECGNMTTHEDVRILIVSFHISNLSETP